MKTHHGMSQDSLRTSSRIRRRSGVVPPPGPAICRRLRQPCLAVRRWGGQTRFRDNIAVKYQFVAKFQGFRRGGEKPIHPRYHAVARRATGLVQTHGYLHTTWISQRAVNLPLVSTQPGQCSFSRPSGRQIGCQGYASLADRMDPRIGETHVAGIRRWKMGYVLFTLS